jgi:micrococcal nuclease
MAPFTKLPKAIPSLRMASMLPGAVALWVACGLATDLAFAAQKNKPAPPPRSAPTAPVFVGTVSRVVDGQTLWLRVDGQGASQLVVRIEGIDAPETCQPGGSEAIAALNDLALGHTVTVRVAARDERGRAVGRVYDGEKDIGNRMVRDGRAWSVRYQYDRGPYVAEERMATSLKRGLHASGSALAPVEFRKQHGPCDGTAAMPSPLERVASGRPLTIVARANRDLARGS